MATTQVKRRSISVAPGRPSAPQETTATTAMAIEPLRVLEPRGSGRYPSQWPLRFGARRPLVSENSPRLTDALTDICVAPVRRCHEVEASHTHTKLLWKCFHFFGANTWTFGAAGDWCFCLCKELRHLAAVRPCAPAAALSDTWCGLAGPPCASFMKC